MHNHEELSVHSSKNTSHNACPPAEEEVAGERRKKVSRPSPTTHKWLLNEPQSHQQMSGGWNQPVHYPS